MPIGLSGCSQQLFRLGILKLACVFPIKVVIESHGLDDPWKEI